MTTPGRAALLAALVLLATSGLCAAAAAADAPRSDPEIETLQQEIDARGYHWTARRTWLTDLSEEERASMLGLIVPEDVARRDAALTEAVLPFPVRRDHPAAFDWRDYGGVSSVKNQAGCGSCWLFGAVAALESAVLINEGIEYDLCEQQVLSCRTPGYGCSGGFPTWAWNYIRDNGAALEECMPYEADDTVPCEDEFCQKYAAVNEWVDIPNTEDAIKTALGVGPVTTSFTVYNDFYSYGSGCYENPGTDPTNHCMLICGWDDDACGGEGAWLVKNSWDTSWGDDGFVWIKYGSCNVGSNARLLYYYEGDEVVYRSHSVDDGAGGDGDGRPDPGETVDIDVELRNDILAPNRTGVSATLSTTSPHVTVTHAGSFYGDIDTGESKTGATPFTIIVDEFAPAGVQVGMQLDITANMIYSYTQTFTLVLGPVPVLLVDDDGSTSTQTYFEESLDRTGYVYDLWTEDLDGNVTAAKMADYPVVIWNVGWNGNLNDDNRAALATHLDAGRPLFISGEDIGWSLDYYGHIDFLHDYLHADYIEDDSGYRSLDGVSGDPIGDGLSFTLNGEDSAMNQFYPSEIEPRDSAVGIFEYEPGLEGAIRMDAAHKLVFYAFGVEGVTGAAVRDTIVARTLEWLVDTWPDTEQPAVAVLTPNGGEEVTGDDDYEVTWDATDNVGVTSIDILLSRDGGATFPETIATGEANDGSFLWAVPDSACETNRIRIVARDAAGLAMYDDSDAVFVTTTGSGVDDWPTPKQLALFQNSPNPFNPVTRIAFAVPRASRVVLDIYDTAGRRVRRLVDRDATPDRYEAVWDGKNDDGAPVASGIYLYRLMSDGEELARKMVLLR